MENIIVVYLHIEAQTRDKNLLKAVLQNYLEFMWRDSKIIIARVKAIIIARKII